MGAELHNVLAAALKASAEPPTFVPHGGGPKPVLHNATYVALAHWIARQVAPAVTAEERGHFELVLGLVDHPLTQSDEYRLIELVLVDGERGGPHVTKGLSPAHTVAHGVAFEALEAHRNGMCGPGCRAAAVAALQLLGKDFLAALDKELLRLDAVTVMQRQELESKSPVAETLWRGATGLKTTHWIVRLEDGGYGLLSKTKGRWVFLTGSRDDVLATVPDAHMQAAVDAVLGPTAGSRREAGPKVRAVLQTALPYPVLEAALSADATRGFLLGPDGLHEIDGRTGKPVRELPTVGRGLAVSASGKRLLLRTPETVLWDGGKSRPLAAKADGALFLGEVPVTWHGEALTFHGKQAKTVTGPKGPRLFARNERVYALGDGAGLVLDTEGTVLESLTLEGDHHAVSSDGRIASWRTGDELRTVSLQGGPELRCEKGRITRVCFAGDLVLVAYHGGKRAVAFGADGGQRHAFDGKELGEVVEELIPLEKGAWFGFAPWERGIAMLVDPDAHVLGSFRLGVFYAGGTTAFAQASDRLLFAACHSALRNSLLLVSL